MITPTAPSSASSGVAAARRYDAAVANIAPPAVTKVATDVVDGTILAPAAYSANAAVARTADETRGSLVDVLA